MKCSVSTSGSDVIKAIDNWSIICQTQIIPKNWRQTTRIHFFFFFFCIAYKEKVNIGRLVTPSDSTSSTPMYPTLDPVTDSWQLVHVIRNIVVAATLTIRTHRLEHPKKVQASKCTLEHRTAKKATAIAGWLKKALRSREMRLMKIRNVNTGKLGK